jgi:hypothetical protein
MMSRISPHSLALSPLEQFVLDYVEARDGAWDEIEPQVYDLLVGEEMTRVAFDPEALPEHPQAQLASLGSPLFDRILDDAARRWSTAAFYLLGVNLRPRDLDSRVRRSISLPPDALLTLERVRQLNFPVAVFWFKATFVGDQKEEEILPTAIDLHYLRPVRHLDAILSPERLSEEPEANQAEAPHAGLVAGYHAARDHVAGSVAALANARRRQWAGRVDKQIERMSRYYAQLRSEARERAQVDASLAARLETIEREERLRVTELRQKSAVRVAVNLASLMTIRQPKLLIWASVSHKGRPAGRMQLVWDTLTEAVEAVPCPACGHPSLAFRIDRGGIACVGCRKSPHPAR